jgi:hypothetical protein
MLTPIEKEVDRALEENLRALKEALLDMLAGLALVLIALVSLLHSVVRVVFAGLGLVLWALALLNVGLHGLRGWIVSRSASSLHFSTHEKR